MPPKLSSEHKEAGSACRRGSVDEHQEAGSVCRRGSVDEHQEAGSACRRGPVRSGAGCAGLCRALARNTEKWDIRRSHISHFKECWR